VILFDSHGQLVSRSYGFRIAYSLTPTGWSEMGKLIMLNSSGNPAALGFVPGQPGPNPPPQSAFGLVVFNAEAFKSQDFTDSDTQIGGAGFDNKLNATLPGYGPEAAEETWIDQNSVPLIVNRYNGTLIRGE